MQEQSFTFGWNGSLLAIFILFLFHIFLDIFEDFPKIV
jgi:hypothetical protein